MEFNPPCGKQWISDLITPDKRYFPSSFFFLPFNFLQSQNFPKTDPSNFKKEKKEKFES